MPKEIDAAAQKRTQDVNRVALRMKQYYGGDMDMVQHFVRVYTLAKSIGELEHLSDEWRTPRTMSTSAPLTTRS